MHSAPWKTRLLKIFLSVLIIGSIAGFMYEWEYSPVQRVAAWSTLYFGSYSTEAEAFAAVEKTLADATLTPEEVVAKANSYGIVFELRTVSKNQVALPFSIVEATDDAFLAENSYQYPVGTKGLQEVLTKELTHPKTSMLIHTYTVSGDIILEPKTATQYNGTLDKKVLEQNLLKQWTAFVTAASKKDTVAMKTFLQESDQGAIPTLLALPDLSYRLGATPAITFEVKDESDEHIQVATITLTQKECSTVPTVVVLYKKQIHTYTFAYVYKSLTELCVKPKTITNPISCSNCTYAPVNKSFGLRSTYTPYVVATGVNGGGYVTPATRDALQKLFKAAQAAGLTPRVSSSYRSFTTQTDLFNTYVKNEQNAGLTYAKAVEKANTYSAKPGHSEHQLGTTVDIVACNYPCSFYDAGNSAWYSYLQLNAHKYGFVISYPNGSQDYTGYIYEPWHVRYVGVEFATELYNRGYLTKKGYYLYQFLVDKRMW